MKVTKKKAEAPSMNLVVRSRNIGPSVGDHDLGVIDGAGLYLFTGPNTDGKSRHLALLGKLHDDELLRKSVEISDGEMDAKLELGAYSVEFRRTASKVKPPKTIGEDTLPPIRTLPAPIEELISGGNLKGAEPRARRRLESLLTYAPVEATEARLQRLTKSLGGRAFSEAPEEEAWMRRFVKLAVVAKGDRRFKIAESFGTEASITDGFLNEQAGESVLDAHGELVETLNTLANTADKALSIQSNNVAELVGGLDQAAKSASAEVGHDVPVQELLDAKVDSLALTAATGVRDLLKADRLRQQEEIDRIQGFRESHGERPDAEALMVSIDEKQDELDKADNDLAATTEVEIDDGKKLARLEGVLAEKQRALSSVVETFGFECEGIVELFDSPVETDINNFISYRNEVEASLASIQSAFQDMLSAKNECLSEHKLLCGVRDRRILLGEVAAALHAERKELALSLEDVNGAVEKWDANQALLDGEVPGPTDEDLEAAEAKMLAASRNEILARAGQQYRGLAAQLEHEQEFETWLEDCARDYRTAKDDSWHHLGAVVTDAVAIPWLSVEGMTILLRYQPETKRLVTDPEAKFEERDIDDEVRISTGELHEAMLRLMLERQSPDKGVSFLIVPWAISAALDDRRAGELSQDAVERNLVVISERPWREGEPEELRLVKVAPVKRRAS